MTHNTTQLIETISDNTPSARNGLNMLAQSVQHIDEASKLQGLMPLTILTALSIKGEMFTSLLINVCSISNTKVLMILKAYALDILTKESIHKAIHNSTTHKIDFSKLQTALTAANVQLNYTYD